MSLRPKDFVQMASVKCIIVVKECILLTLRRMQSVAGFSPCRQFCFGRNDVTFSRPGRQEQFKMAASEVAFFETYFFKIAGTSEADTLVSGKAECLL